jgi:hypothetical protein
MDAKAKKEELKEEIKMSDVTLKESKEAIAEEPTEFKTILDAIPPSVTDDQYFSEQLREKFKKMDNQTIVLTLLKIWDPCHEREKGNALGRGLAKECILRMHDNKRYEGNQS